MLLAARVLGSGPDGDMRFAENVRTRDTRVYVLAVTWDDERPMPFWCSGLHHSEAACFAGEIPVLQQLPPVTTPVIGSDGIRHISFTGSAARDGDGTVLAAGCEQPGSAAAICLENVGRDRAVRPPRFLPAAENSYNPSKVQVAGDVVLSFFEKDVYAQTASTEPERVLRDVVHFDASVAGDRLQIAYADRSGVRVLELDESLGEVRDTKVATAKGVRRVAYDGETIAWIDSDGISVVEGAPAEDVRVKNGFVVWSERLGTEHVLHAWRDGNCVIAGRTDFDDGPLFFDLIARDDGRTVVVWRASPTMLAWRAL